MSTPAYVLAAWDFESTREEGCAFAIYPETTSEPLAYVVKREGAEEIARLMVAAPKLAERVRVLEESLNWCINQIDNSTCQHESTHRGGAIWTICDDCGNKWADDRGGFVPYVEPKELAAAREALAGAAS